MSAARSAPNLPRAQMALVALVLVGTVQSWMVSPPVEARRRDRKPPAFAGIASATTCIPGPIGSGISSSYHLTWQPAADKVSPSSAIVYEIYQADESGGEDLSTPTYVTAPGATSFDTPPLPSDQTFFFIVRATDEAGNIDSNTVEREGFNLCV
jgi:hypothetical protein